jgi:SSS family solute:Na+ symporter
LATAATFVLRALKTPPGIDTTIKGDYFDDDGDPRVKPLNEPIHLVTPSV